MEAFDPIRHIAGSSSILEPDGTWPSFYESEVHSFNFWRGDFQTDGATFTSPEIEVSIEMSTNEIPYLVDFKFHECDFIEMSNFNHQNVIEEFKLSFEERLFYSDGVTPLPVTPIQPYICVKIGTPNYTVALSFKCLKVEVVGKRDILQPTRK